MLNGTELILWHPNEPTGEMWFTASDLARYKGIYKVLNWLGIYTQQLYLLKNNEGNIIGRGTLRSKFNFRACRSEYWLYGILILPQYRLMGGGKCLINSLISKVKAKGVKELSLWVDKDNIAAIRLYTSCGFITEGYKNNEILMKYYIHDKL